MGGLELGFGIALLVFAVGIILIVLLQQGEQRNNGGVMTGSSSDTYISRHSGRTIDAFLSRWTKIFAIGFFICVIVVNIMVFFFSSVDHAEAIDPAEGTESAVSEVVSEAEGAASESSSAAESAAASAVESTAETSAADQSAA